MERIGIGLEPRIYRKSVSKTFTGLIYIAAWLTRTRGIDQNKYFNGGHRFEILHFFIYIPQQQEPFIIFIRVFTLHIFQTVTTTNIKLTLFPAHFL